MDHESIMKDQRDWMIREHLAARGINDKRVLNIMGKLPREKFVHPKYIIDTYGDHPIPIGHHQTISQPYIVALMTQLCELTGDEKVLEIGSGSGYQTAVLSDLSAEVFSIERIKPLADRASQLLKELGCTNVSIVHGDGYKGLPDKAPFDVILLTAAPEKIPNILIDQLAEKGRLIAPVGDRVQELVLLKKKNGIVTGETVTFVSFVPMVEGCN